jgi:NDP-sugar pyrophosphorylase family protein
MVLAAGRGTRLGELGKRTAKALVPIDGEPLLAHQLRYLGGEGVERVVVNASHLSQQVEDFASEHSGRPALEVIVEPEQPLGTAGGVINALPELSEDPLLILYGDVISGEPLDALASVHDAAHPVASLAVYYSEDARQKGVVELEGSRVTAFYEKDPARRRGWVNAGVYIVEPGWLAMLAPGAGLDFGIDVFPEAIRSGLDLRAYRLREPVRDIGTPVDLASARKRGLGRPAG